MSSSALRASTLPITSVRFNSTITPPPNANLPSSTGEQDGLSELKDFDIAEEEEIQWPNLMERDPIYDDGEVTEFPTSRRFPYANSVTMRGLNPSEEGEGSRIAEDSDKDYSLYATMNPKLFMHRYNLVNRSVVHQTGKGKIRSRAVLCVVGNGKGLLGYGYVTDPKSDMRKAQKKAIEEALRNMDYVDRFEDRTVWTEMESKFGSTKIILRPRPVGFGLRCNPYIHQICKAAGIKDLSAKVWGSRRPMMVIHGVIRMLQGGHAPLGMGDGFGGSGKRLAAGSGMRRAEDIERERGRRIIPLRT